MPYLVVDTHGNTLIRKDGETPLYDGLGSERTVTNTSGGVQGSLTLTAFGQAVASSGGSSDPYEFAATSGYRNDGDAGLALVGARYYDAQTGSFVSRDTVLSQLPYAYCDGDPVNGVDPSGHDPDKIPPIEVIWHFLKLLLYPFGGGHGGPDKKFVPKPPPSAEQGIGRPDPPIEGEPPPTPEHPVRWFPFGAPK